MKTIAKLGLTTLVIIVLFFSCKQAEASKESVSIESAVITKDSISSSSTFKKTENKKFIRTADIKFKVKNVIQSTYAIENTTNKFGGFVTHTNLQSTMSDKIKTKISQDSTLETTKYSVENNITIRVPNSQLDIVIKTIAKQIDFLDYRIIKADDVSIQMIANQLKQNRNAIHQKRVEKAIDTKGKKLNDITDAENDLLNKKEQDDTSKIENLTLQDQVNFSTLTLTIYQHESVKREMIATEKGANYYKPNIGLELFDAIKNGWYILQEIIVFLIQLWSLFAIGIICFTVYSRFLKTKM